MHDGSRGRRLLMRSAEFDDVYFYEENGLAETRHTFLDGNNLPAAWADAERFCICETGFGTGLNMLAVWKLFQETAKPHQRLDLISIEKYPLTREQIREALSRWRDELDVERMLDAYPLRVRGFHRIVLSPQVTLTLIFDDVQNALPEIDAQVDAWFLDGFTPSKNPDMWGPTLYQQMARLSHKGTTFATFTVAGIVKRGLREAGFGISRRPGFGKKWAMLAGVFDGGDAKKTVSPPRHVAVIGGGLAGLSAAWHLRRAGVSVTVYEAEDEVAAQASGNALGILNPKLTAKPSAQSDYYTSAYAYALRVLAGFTGIDFSPHGSLHLQSSDDKARRFAGYCESLGWHSDHMRLLDADAASDIAGVPLGVPCLYYPDTGAASPLKLCRAMAEGLEVVTGTRIASLDALKADAVVIANAAAVTAFFPSLPVGRVRGQVSVLSPNDVSKQVRTNLSYGGYLSPLMASGQHMCGATFQPWGETPEVTDDDHKHNLLILAEAVPSLGGGMAVQGGRVGFRASSKDRLPIIGAHQGVFLSVAHGSHGMISGLLGGAIMAAKLAGGPMPIGVSAMQQVAADRFSKG